MGVMEAGGESSQGCTSLVAAKPAGAGPMAAFGALPTVAEPGVVVRIGLAASRSKGPVYLRLLDLVCGREASYNGIQQCDECGESFFLLGNVGKACGANMSTGSVGLVVSLLVTLPKMGLSPGSSFVLGEVGFDLDGLR
jgi:hypothetical protein